MPGPLIIDAPQVHDKIHVIICLVDRVYGAHSFMLEFLPCRRVLGQNEVVTDIHVSVLER